ncbi:hypothetical protein DQW50_16245 [Halorubrum sp. 48-1-W]|uniref:hypothetical protein n=1 Tax=Halorubrum sp. 48-1-W TaxID=2249761 RepID=UPI000DCB73DF|nr:hypothetical protein [Halorubrum sp. 48-1-W]RAW44073.1 hypothetical protein DQW50_16245 [Halorubrum sp. 48-1-W]
MTNLDRVEAARQSLTTAVTRSREQDRATAETRVFSAELKLRQGGRPDLARRLEATLTGDVTTASARRELREVAQLLDAELSPDVDGAFIVASDGGERE